MSHIYLVSQPSYQWIVTRLGECCRYGVWIVTLELHPSVDGGAQLQVSHDKVMMPFGVFAALPARKHMMMVLSLVGRIVRTNLLGGYSDYALFKSQSYTWHKSFVMMGTGTYIHK